MILKVLILIFLALRVSDASTRQIPFAVLTGNFPNHYTSLGRLRAQQSIKITLTNAKPDEDVQFYLRRGPNLEELNFVSSSDYVDPFTNLVEKTLDIEDNYWIAIYPDGNYFTEFYLKVEIDGVQTYFAKKVFYYDYKRLPVYKISISNTCSLKLSYSGSALEEIDIYDVSAALADTPLVAMTTNTYVFDVKAPGDYYFTVNQLEHYPSSLQYFTLTMTTSCDSACQSPDFKVVSCTPVVCGDGKLDDN